MGSRNMARPDLEERQEFDAERQRRKISEMVRFIEKTRPLVPDALGRWCKAMGITNVPEVAVRNLGCTLDDGIRRAKYQIDFTVNGLQFRGHVTFTDDRCRSKVRLIWPNGARGPTITSVEELSTVLAGASAPG